MSQSIPFQLVQDQIATQMQQQSVSDTLNSGIDIASESSRDTNGWANTFTSANIAGVMLRITSSGGTPPSDGQNWTGSNTKIAHNLGYIPMGWLVTYKSKTCDVFAGSTAPDAQFIYLSISDDTVDTNLFIF